MTGTDKVAVHEGRSSPTALQATIFTVEVEVEMEVEVEVEWR